MQYLESCVWQLAIPLQSQRSYNLVAPRLLMLLGLLVGACLVRSIINSTTDKTVYCVRNVHAYICIYVSAYLSLGSIENAAHARMRKSSKYLCKLMLL